MVPFLQTIYVMQTHTQHTATDCCDHTDNLVPKNIKPGLVFVSIPFWLPWICIPSNHISDFFSSSLRIYCCCYFALFWGGWRLTEIEIEGTTIFCTIIIPIPCNNTLTKTRKKPLTQAKKVNAPQQKKYKLHHQLNSAQMLKTITVNS